ncbi:ABC transporter substrate-binding protein [Jiangella rhizosphaerae]|uniref:Extracellular solute-binding protein n=1 Tax=Jiangella rhizosphaerae TaxID=2293569 RepID=A0A418KPN1_9ACTN|nr:extracellular solute-binding protein [Jiangella rhizosphaerae]RIQ21465.1 extracellular solute-binding protein [Jiangella rhizosphaerae]
MAKPLFRRTAVAALTTALVAALAACGTSSSDDDPASGGGGDTPDSDAPVTISINDLPPTEEPERRQSMLDKIERFEEANPHITIEATEYRWAADTFPAMLAGGTEPTVTALPFTEVQGLAARGQAAEISEQLEGAGFLEDLNPGLMEVVTAPDGGIYGVPYAAYTAGLIYNRALFEQAGLDPDDPPKTWDDIRAAARTIQEKTGVPGLISMTTENVGGWTLTAMSAAFGGLMEEVDGETATASFDSEPTKQALEFLRALRWEDDTMGANFLINWEDSRNEFGAGRAGMMIAGADAYTDLVETRGLPPEAFGVAPLPQDDDAVGALSGGSVDLISARATPEQIDAALTWIQFNRFAKYYDEQTALDNVDGAAKDGRPVGTIELPIVSQELYDQYLGWIEELINVPRENAEYYLTTIQEIPLVSEPPVKGQELYAALDPVVQAVLTREDADIDALLAEAEDNVNALIQAG